MAQDSLNDKLKAKAEQIINFTPHDIQNITPEEIQRLFYDLQVYQIELHMQNEELQKSQFELSQVNNRLSFAYHSVPVGILTVDFQGFIQQTNHTFADMLCTSPNALVKKHFSKLIVDEDVNIFIQRFDAFFKSPANKSMQLRLKSEKNTVFDTLLKGSADDGTDTIPDNIELKQRKLVIAVTDISEVVNKT